jgi:hypothetical protein
MPEPIIEGFKMLPGGIQARLESIATHGGSAAAEVGRTATVSPEQLSSPVRNRYFYGKLLDAMHLEMEQSYFNDKRWLLNRLTTGSGVVAGLSLEITGDKKHVAVWPGVALDEMGREVIVPRRSQPIDPLQPTDVFGAARGARLTGAQTVVIGIGYHECESEPTPSLACECDDDGCEYGAIRERYAVLVWPGHPESAGSTAQSCGALFRPNTSVAADRLWEARVQAIAARSRKYHDAIALSAVPLAYVTVDADGGVTKVDYSCRVPVVSNNMLLGLLLCLAAELDKCCARAHTLTLAAAASQSQVANVGQLASEPPAVRVERDGQPAANVPVSWSVGSTGGTIGDGTGPDGASATTKTGADGIARLARWRMPNEEGRATVRAAVSGAAPASLDFAAEVRSVAVRLPHIVAVWPPNGAFMKVGSTTPASELEQWLAEPFLDLTFDEEMDDGDLARDQTRADGWLRAVSVASLAPVAMGFNVQQLGIQFMTRMPSAIGGQAGVTYRFRLTELSTAPAPAMRHPMVLVMVQAQGGNIRSKATGQLLDPDFDGGVLRRPTPAAGDIPTFEAVWDLASLPTDSGRRVAENLFSALLGAPHTPITATGDGQPGGRLHCHFDLARQ